MPDLHSIHVFDQNIAAAKEWLGAEDNWEKLADTVEAMIHSDGPDNLPLLRQYWTQIVGLSILGMQYLEMSIEADLEEKDS